MTPSSHDDFFLSGAARRIVESAVEGVWSLDESFVTTFVNTRLAEKLGYEPAEMVGRPVEEFLFPEDLPDHEMRKAERRTGKGSVYERRLKKKDGRGLWAIVSVTPIEDGDGRFAGTFTTCTDITERLEAEAALEESERRYRQIFENAVEGIFQSAPDGRMLRINPAGARMGGFSSPLEMVEAMAGGDYQLWQDLDARARLVRRLGEEGTVRGFEAEVRRKGGERLWISINATLVRDAEGRVVSHEGTMEDVTEVRRARQLLAEQARFLESLVEAMPYPVFYKDRGGRYLGCNRAFENFFGLDKSEIVGRTVEEIFPPGSAEVTRFKDEELLASLGVQVYEWAGPAASGETRNALFQRATFAGPDGQVAGIIGSIVDITDLKIAEGRIRQLNEELEARVRERTAALILANKELESFSYSVSHDLRAPLRAISGFSDMALAESGAELSPAAREHLDRVIAAARKMSRLIDALLGLSRIARKEIRIQPVDLSAGASEVLRELMVHQAGREVDVIVASGVRAQGDPDLLRVVLRNLLENALKFTVGRAKARIEFGVTANVPGAPPGLEGRPVYFVRDDGAGFDMKYVHKLFGPFQRLHAESQFPGSGIGLANTQRIVHRHGGIIWAEGAPDVGATFYFTLGEAVEAA